MAEYYLKKLRLRLAGPLPLPRRPRGYFCHVDFAVTRATSPCTLLLRDDRPINSNVPSSPLFYPWIDTNQQVPLPSCLPPRCRASSNLLNYPSRRTPSALIRLTARFRGVSVHTLSRPDCVAFPQNSQTGAAMAVSGGRPVDRFPDRPA